ncbi:ornithine cyclodeaminase family protein [Brucella anthropi]|uniref:Ornithine cyclodeaminase family protein n=1 Tax=Brucella anthropi TaxID=529 RepID=A0A6I0DJR2_BRUAN|nr:ornithine cyclodeaminase family protein [Brucella anthropi]KAB2790322.1 ornithine cyclodeaminase family protein [Brucella anthropi]
MSKFTPRFITENDVAELVSLNDAIAALERMLAREGQALACNIPKSLGTFGPQSSLHALGSYSQDAKLGGFKTWVNTPEGAAAVMSVFDTELGQFLALIQAGLLGQLRTAGISGLATDWLAPADANDMALVGTGRQAMMQVASIAAVRKLTRLRVYSPTPESRGSFVAKARQIFSFNIVDAASLGEALDGAEIVTLVTRAQTPFVSADMLADNVHVNAVGAVLPKNGEIEASVIEKARLVVVDSQDGARQNSREFKEYFGEEASGWHSVRTIGEVIAEGRKERPAGLTLFKAMGMGLSDLAIAEMVLSRADKLDGVASLCGAPGMPNARWTEKA